METIDTAEYPLTPSQGLTLASRLELYRELTKSGIVALVLISTSCGFFIGKALESKEGDFLKFVLLLLGTFLLAAGGSALNQVQERHIDARMPRTAKRPIPSGKLPVREALILSIALLLTGVVLLATLSSVVLILGLAAFVSYNGFYTLWWKRRWAFAAIPGAIPGALPILMGYAGATGKVFTLPGFYLFTILFLWQMPHFWAIALRYQKDYALGQIPTLPVVYGDTYTLNQIGIWCLAYLGTALLAPFVLHASWIYVALSIPMAAKIFIELIRFSQNPYSKSWLHFFLWINFSLIIFLSAAVTDAYVF